MVDKTRYAQQKFLLGKEKTQNTQQLLVLRNDGVLLGGNYQESCPGNGQVGYFL